MDSDQQFRMDVRRAIILGQYICYWGMPLHRMISRSKDDIVEVYSFPPSQQSPIHRFASIGFARSAENKSTSYELLMTLPPHLGGASEDESMRFVLDVFVHGLRDDVRLSDGALVNDVPIMPQAWYARSLLVSEPLGEPRELSTIHVGKQHVDLLWLIPVYSEEMRFIETHGLSAFFAVEPASEWGLVDPTRPVSEIDMR